MAGYVSVWALPSGTLAYSAKVFSQAVYSVGFRSNDLLAASDGEIALFEQMDLRDIIRHPLGHSGVINACFLKQCAGVFLAGHDESIQVLDLPDVSERWSAKVPWHRARPNLISLADDQSKALTLSIHDHAIKLRAWSLRDGHCSQFQGYDGTFAIATDGKVGYIGRYCAAAQSYTVVMMDLETGAYIDSLDVGLDGHATALSVNHKGDRLLIGLQSGNVGICPVSPGSGFDPHSFVIVGHRNAPISQVGFVDENLIVSTSGNRLRCWKV